MSSDKKYYWLKLKDDFFRQKEIKKLRKIAGGDTYTIIYLKLQLLSLQNEGKLLYEGIEDDFAEELALELDEDVDNLKITLSYLEKHGMLEIINNDEYLLPETVKSIGSETKSAERMRRMRKKKDVTMLQECSEVLHRDRDRDRDRDKRKEIEVVAEEKNKSTTAAKNPFKIYSQNIGLISPHIAQKIQIFLDDGITDELMSRYIEVATERDIKNWSYIEKIVQGNLEKNIKTLEQYESYMLEWSKNNNSSNNKKVLGKVIPQHNFEQREYSEEEYEKFYSNISGG